MPDNDLETPEVEPLLAPTPELPLLVTCTVDGNLTPPGACWVCGNLTEEA